MGAHKVRFVQLTDGKRRFPRRRTMSENLSHRRPVCVLRHRAESEGSRRYSWTTTSRSDICRVGRLLNAAFDAVSRFRALPSAASSTHAALDARARHMARTPRSSRPRASSTTSLADPSSLVGHAGRAHYPIRAEIALSEGTTPRRPRGASSFERAIALPRRSARPRPSRIKTKCCPMLRVLLDALLLFTSLASASASTWTEVKPTEYFRDWKGITSSSDGTKLAAVTWGYNIWTSTDSGETWTSRASTKNWAFITSSSDGTKLAATANEGNIWTSTDSGETWTSRASLRKWYGITSSSDGTKLAATVDGGRIWTSTDSGETWTEVEPSGSNRYWYGITSSSDGTKLAAAALEGNIWTYRTPVCDENSHVSNGACVPCGPGASRAQGDLIDGGDTECACVKDYYVSNGACVACDPALGRAPGDVPSNGDTECECKCKARTRAWGFSMSD